MSVEVQVLHSLVRTKLKKKKKRKEKRNESPPDSEILHSKAN